MQQLLPADKVITVDSVMIICYKSTCLCQAAVLTDSAHCQEILQRSGQPGWKHVIHPCLHSPHWLHCSLHQLCLFELASANTFLSFSLCTCVLLLHKPNLSQRRNCACCVRKATGSAESVSAGGVKAVVQSSTEDQIVMASRLWHNHMH